MLSSRLHPWSRVRPSEYRSLDLRAHTILAGVPLHDVWQLDLPGGGEGRTVTDIRSLVRGASPSAPVRALFGLRRVLGRILGWDRPQSDDAGLFIHRLSDSDRDLSEVAPGTQDGPFTVLYVHDSEAASEVRNGTVHAALVWVLLRRESGYRLLWAIHVKPVGPLTGLYMRAIDPFRRYVVYPSLLRRLHRAWCEAYEAT